MVLPFLRMLKLLVSSENVSEVVGFLPRWAWNVGSLVDANALVRARCGRCDALIRVSPEVLTLRFGRALDLRLHSEMCSMVGCSGQVAFVVSKKVDGPWIEIPSVGPKPLLSIVV